MKPRTAITALICGGCLSLATTTALGQGTINSPDGTWRADIDAAGQVVNLFTPDQPGSDNVFETLLYIADSTTGQLSLLQLREQIEWRAREGRSDLRQRVAFHSRLAMPLTVLLFAWLAIPLGMSVERTRSMAGSGLLAIGVLALFQTTWRTNALLADNGFAFAAAGPWAALAAFAALGAWLFSRALR